MRSDKQKKFNISKNRIIIFTAILIVILSTIFFSSKIEHYINYRTNSNYNVVLNSNFKVHYINVGQGDCCCIEFPDGKIMLIDSGTVESSESIVDYLNKYVLQNSKIIDYFVITHPHLDHIGAGKAILNLYDIKNIYRPNVYSYTESINKEFGDLNVHNLNEYDELVEAINNEAVNGIKSNVYFNSCFIEIEEQDYKIEFLSPNENKYDNLNNYSPIILITINNKKFMFTGDAETEIENEILTLNSAYFEYLDIDVLKVAHHGSNTSSKDNFLEVIRPEFAVISVGENNDYNNPSSSVLERLSTNGVQSIYRTDVVGNVVISVINNEIVVGYFKQNFPIYIKYVYFLFCAIALDCFIFLLPSKLKD